MLGLPADCRRPAAACDSISWYSECVVHVQKEAPAERSGLFDLESVDRITAAAGSHASPVPPEQFERIAAPYILRGA